MMDFQYRQSTVYYRAKGKGQVVVLVHGFGEDGSIWQEQINALCGHCRVIVPDLPGSGKSLLLEEPDGGDVSMKDFAAVLHAMLIHENAEQCIMLGHSMGGYITLAFAEQYPQLLTGFGLVHSTAFADNAEKKAARQKGIELMKQYGGWAFLKNTIPNLFAAEYKSANPKKVEQLIEQARGFDTTAMVQYYQAMMNRPNSTSVLQLSKVPVLFIAGKLDVAAPIQDVLQQVHLPDLSFIHLMEGVGHMGMWEQTELVNTYLIQFIAEVKMLQKG